MRKVAVVKCNNSPKTPAYHSVLRNNYKVNDTHDFKKGSPKLQLNKEPLLGASVATTRSATQVDVSPLLALIKSRGSTGNICPPIWNASECGVEQGNSG